LSIPSRLTDWQTYGHTNPVTLGNAAWNILAGRCDRATVAELAERCARCRRIVPGRGHLVQGCWHQAALMLFDQGLHPLPPDGEDR
jgi:hypothetical protein